MDEKKNGLSLPGAIVILSVVILFSSCQITGAIGGASFDDTDDNDYQFELSRLNDNFEELIEIFQKTNKSD